MTSEEKRLKKEKKKAKKAAKKAAKEAAAAGDDGTSSSILARIQQMNLNWKIISNHQLNQLKTKQNTHLFYSVN